MYRGFRVVVNGHISLPLPCHTTLHVLLKGMLVVSHVCVSLLCRCPPGCYVSGCPSAPRWAPLGLPPVHPSSSPQQQFRGARPLGVPSWLLGFCFLHASRLLSLAGPGASVAIRKLLRDLPRDPGPSRLRAVPSQALHPPRRLGQGARPQLPALPPGAAWPT